MLDNGAFFFFFAVLVLFCLHEGLDSRDVNDLYPYTSQIKTLLSFFHSESLQQN